MKKTVIIGASTNSARYSYLAAATLRQYGHEFVPVGLKKGMIFGKQILDIRSAPEITDVDTITLYVSPSHQSGLEDYLLRLKPKRVIFNPGTENEQLEQTLEKAGIEVSESCTLVLLRTGQF
jgi:hypothetical protein